jgi:hypothetical protein
VLHGRLFGVILECAACCVAAIVVAITANPNARMQPPAGTAFIALCARRPVRQSAQPVCLK